MTGRHRGRNVSGILLLDKAIGKTSNQALTEVKKIYEAKKAGHTGSLDLLATGMLPICLGEATKYSQCLLEADKQYLVEGKLGICTTTGDAEGQIIKQSAVKVDVAMLENVLKEFRGEISQIPPMYSALKFQGKPLCYYARLGVDIPRESRKVWIKHLELLDYKDDQIKLLVTCSKGTYIRTLVEDIGEKLGCGAYVVFLRRTYVDPYSQFQMVSIETLLELKDDKHLLDQQLLSADTAVSNYPDLIINDTLIYYIKQGNPVLVAHAPTSGYVRLFSESNTFVGLGLVLDDGRIAPKRLIHAS